MSLLLMTWLKQPTFLTGWRVASPNKSLRAIQVGLSCALLLLLTPLLRAATLTAVTVKQSPDKTSVFCTITSLPSYRGFTLSNPNRAVIDFQQTKTAMSARSFPLGGLIQKTRLGSPSPNALRLVFDISQEATVKISHWQPNSPRMQGLQIDIIPKQGRVFQSTATPQPPIQPKHESTYQPLPKSMVVTRHQAPIRPVPIRHAPRHNGRDIIIVIDAGHGGKDPGAKGPRHALEKDVVLSMALKLKQLIDKQPGMRAVTTRHGDYYIGLRERLNITRKYNADMFVSIHADAFNNQNSHGASVYALSPRGATSEAARWLAEKENYSELGGVDLSGLDDHNKLIRSVLLDLSQTATITASLQIGDNVLRHLDQMTTLHHNKVEQAGFMVLKSPDIPSILVETGFISNPREEFNLTTPAYQARLTNAVFNGIKRYFWEHPPQGSRLEAMSGAAPTLAQVTPPRRSAFR